jgi:putative DNA modification/repair radical SAM protein
MEFYQRNYIEGLFLSSGIFHSPDQTMEQLIRSVRLLREEQGFNGYIHLKAIPGASPDLLKQAGVWVDRLSANIELPTEDDLRRLAPEKSHAIIETSMGHLSDRIKEAQEEAASPRFAPAGQTTQMVIGATPTSDAAILLKADQLYRTYRLRRVYYSGFSPFPNADSRLPINKPPLLREHRLYQADWLMRFYGFASSELVEQAHLDLDMDPKLAWALRHREHFPVDINRASRELLLRVPGLGYRNVDRVIAIRRHHRLTHADLRRLGVTMKRADPFIVTGDGGARMLDRHCLPALLKNPVQLTLFEAGTESAHGEL